MCCHLHQASGNLARLQLSRGGARNGLTGNLALSAHRQVEGSCCRRSPSCTRNRGRREKAPAPLWPPVSFVRKNQKLSAQMKVGAEAMIMPDSLDVVELMMAI
jgi:hypothetical protein